MSDKLKDLRGRLNERRGQVHKALEEMGPENDFSKVTDPEITNCADDDAKAKQLQAWDAEMTDLAQQIEKEEGIDGIRGRVDAMSEQRPHPGHPTGGRQKQGEAESIGELFTAHPAFGKQPEGHMGPEAEFNDVDIRATLFQTTTGWAPPAIRQDRVVGYAVRPLVLADILPTVQVNGPTYIYMEETTFANSAVEVGEGLAKAEAGLALTEVSETIRKIAAWIPVTDEQLEDVPAVRQYIDNRLGYMVRQRLDTQIIAGPGTGVTIKGINRTARSTMQTQAKGGDTVHDAVYKAITKIRVNAFSEPTNAVFHPNDWQAVRLAQATGSGVYLWGNPSEAGVERIFGLPTVLTTGMTENTALVGDFNQAALLLRQGLTMKVGYVNDDLIKNKQTIVAELRAAVAVFRPAAFCEVTGV